MLIDESSAVYDDLIYNLSGGQLKYGQSILLFSYKINLRRVTVWYHTVWLCYSMIMISCKILLFYLHTVKKMLLLANISDVWKYWHWCLEKGIVFTFYGEDSKFSQNTCLTNNFLHCEFQLFMFSSLKDSFWGSNFGGIFWLVPPPGGPQIWSKNFFAKIFLHCEFQLSMSRSSKFHFEGVAPPKDPQIWSK